MNKLIYSTLKKITGKKRLQNVFEKLFQLSLKGMNYGNIENFKDSGEYAAMLYIKSKVGSSKPLTIFDVGANVGRYSNELSSIFKNDAIIHAFEPSKKTFELFLKNTEQLTNLICNNFGFSDIESEMTLYTNTDASGLASLYNRNLDHFGITMDKSEKIQLKTIDKYCRDRNIERINFLKLDIEGHELNALKGAKQMIDNGFVDFIQFEFGGCNIDSRTYFQDYFYLLNKQYRIYRLLKDGLVEIPKYKETHEIFLTINFLAERIK